MQTRKVAVEIKTVDDKHCSDKCKSMSFDQYYLGVRCLMNYNFLRKDSIGYIRTKKCIESEKPER